MYTCRLITTVTTHDYLFDLFTKTSTIHETGHAEFNFALPKSNTYFCKKSFSYRGVVAWNSLPSELKNLDSLATFKNTLRFNSV